MIYKSLFARLFLLFSFTFLTLSSAFADEIVDQGKALFKANCASCHNKNMIDAMTGPALGGTNERWDGRDDILYQWIRNSSAVIASGDSYAVGIYNEYNKSVMTSFPNLTDEEINSVLVYIQCTYDKSCLPPPPPPKEGEVVGAQKSDNTFLFITLFIILGILALVLARIITNLNRMADIKEGKKPEAQKSLLQSITGSGVVGFIIFALVIFGGYTTVNNAIDLGRQQGYQPDQPIKFSHVTHAGLNKVDCQYCH
ncbi:MAG: mono/diheme cytochrome c family protein, partial [Saprospiraceae bacterium]